MKDKNGNKLIDGDVCIWTSSDGQATEYWIIFEKPSGYWYYVIEDVLMSPMTELFENNPDGDTLEDVELITDETELKFVSQLLNQTTNPKHLDN